MYKTIFYGMIILSFLGSSVNIIDLIHRFYCSTYLYLVRFVNEVGKGFNK